MDVLQQGIDWGWLYNFPLFLPWVVLAGMLVVVLILSTIGVFFFKDGKEGLNIVPTSITIFGLVAIMFCLIIIPVDIFNISHTYDPTIQQIVVKVLYYCSVTYSYP